MVEQWECLASKRRIRVNRKIGLGNKSWFRGRRDWEEESGEGRSRVSGNGRDSKWQWRESWGVMVSGTGIVGIDGRGPGA